MKSLSNGFHTKEEVREVLDDLATDFCGYLKHQCMIITGDYHAYVAEMEAYREDPVKFGCIVPVPGAFHVGLNAQEGVFHWFSVVLEPLWKEVSGKTFTIPMPPLQRKYVLDLSRKGWAICREKCTAAIWDKRQSAVEAFLLTKLFDDLIPVALDLYAVYLVGTIAEYERVLLRGLELFMQLGKLHYVLLAVLFVATIQH